MMMPVGAPSFQERVGHALKAFWGSGVRMVTQVGTRWTWAEGGSGVDYGALAGDPAKASVVMACIQWVQRVFPEAPVQVIRRTATGPQPQPDHALTALVRWPNPAYGGRLLWQATAASYNLTGNGYWIKVRAASGAVVQLWHEPPLTIRPRWYGDGQTGPGAADGLALDARDWISHYEVWRLDGLSLGRWWPLPVADVVHFRFGLNPATRAGLSPLASAAPEIYTDQAALIYTATLLRNLAVPPMVISPAGDATISDPQAIKDNFMARTSGDRRGEPLVLGAPVKIDLLTFPPSALNLRDLRKIPEERVTALLGTPAVVVGLGAGLDRSTFANMAEAREAAYEGNIIPTQDQFADDLTSQLLADFRARPDEEVVFDRTGVRVLQDDQNRLYARQAVGYNAGYLKRSEARRAVGLAADPADDAYKPAAQPTGTQGPPHTRSADGDPASL